MQTDTEELDSDGVISVELENDELVRLVTSNADVASQYVVFQNSQDEYFAINVAKVEELIEYKRLEVVKTSDPSYLIEGTAKVREHMVNVVQFDRWLENSSPVEPYELCIICSYASVRVALVINRVYGVMNIEPTDMYDDSDKDEKISYLCEIVVSGKKILCKIFDTDRFIADVMPMHFQKEVDRSFDVNDHERGTISKEIWLAEDSNLIQEAIKKLLKNMELNYRTFVNGKDLINALEDKDIDEIGLIITDLEMPVMGGLELLELCQKNPVYREIPIVVNTNMANSSIVNSTKKLGAATLINKLDLKTLKEVVLEYARK